MRAAKSDNSIPPPTPILFPRCTPAISQPGVSKPTLVSYLQRLVRPNDLRIEHLEALNLHVVHDVAPDALLPDASFLPPREKWASIPAAELAALDEETRRPLSNGTKSPGAQTFVERLGELSISNDAAFRTIHRLPAAPGQPLIRLGNAYDFYRNLDMVANYWDDTSRPPSAAPDTMKVESADSFETEAKAEPAINECETTKRTGTGALMSNDIRQSLLISFVKLVTYDFGCNVTIPRLEPRLHLKSQRPYPMHSYFPSTPIFVYRTPVARQEARAGIVEGPVVALSPRSMPAAANNPTKSDGATEGSPETDSKSPSTEEVADLAREIINILTMAQIRSREHQTEIRYGDGQWWTTKPRWGGGAGGPIGREIKEPGRESEEPGEKESTDDKAETVIPSPQIHSTPAKASLALTSRTSDSGGVEKPERKKQKIRKKAGGQLEMYDAYRMVRPPATNWDRKSRYMALGKDPTSPFDEIFLISALFHHVSVVRARVSTAYLEALEGRGKFIREEAGDEGEEGKLLLWRSKWYDLFRAEDRTEAMALIWGVMGYLLRGGVEEEKKKGVVVDGPSDEKTSG